MSAAALPPCGSRSQRRLGMRVLGAAQARRVGGPARPKSRCRAARRWRRSSRRRRSRCRSGGSVWANSAARVAGSTRRLVVGRHDHAQADGRTPGARHPCWPRERRRLPSHEAEQQACRRRHRRCRSTRRTRRGARRRGQEQQPKHDRTALDGNAGPGGRRRRETRRRRRQGSGQGYVDHPVGIGAGWCVVFNRPKRTWHKSTPSQSERCAEPTGHTGRPAGQAVGRECLLAGQGRRIKAKLMPKCRGWRLWRQDDQPATDRRPSVESRLIRRLPADARPDRS